uniref:Metallophos_C domain-containing protein n=1 Tax=Macrostomum lignano TaxID=282301 RepID=A0A1I8F8W6_9PLAT
SIASGAQANDANTALPSLLQKKGRVAGVETSDRAGRSQQSSSCPAPSYTELAPAARSLVFTANLLSQHHSETWPKSPTTMPQPPPMPPTLRPAPQRRPRRRYRRHQRGGSALRGAAFLRFLYNRNTGKFFGRRASPGRKSAPSTLFITAVWRGFFCRHAVRVRCTAVSLWRDIPYRTDEPRPGLPAQPSMDSTPSSKFVQGEAGQRMRAKWPTSTDVRPYKEMELKPDNVNVRKACEPDSKPDREPFKVVCKFNWTRWLQDCNPSTDFGLRCRQALRGAEDETRLRLAAGPLGPGGAHPPMVTCFGENPADTENIGERWNISPPWRRNYTGTPGQDGYFSQAYFPYLKQVGYRAPLVAVRFSKPAQQLAGDGAPGELRNLRNSRINTVDRDGMVRFEIFKR